MIVTCTYTKIDDKIYFEREQMIKTLLSLLPYLDSATARNVEATIEKIESIE